jgi:hypothetical protein
LAYGQKSLRTLRRGVAARDAVQCQVLLYAMQTRRVGEAILPSPPECPERQARIEDVSWQAVAYNAGRHGERGSGRPGPKGPRFFASLECSWRRGLRLPLKLAAPLFGPGPRPKPSALLRNVNRRIPPTVTSINRSAHTKAAVLATLFKIGHGYALFGLRPTWPRRFLCFDPSNARSRKYTSSPRVRRPSFRLSAHASRLGICRRPSLTLA